MSRIWHFVKAKLHFGSAPSRILESSGSDRMPVLSATSGSAGKRIAERQRTKAATAVALTAAEGLLGSLDVESSKRLVIRVSSANSVVQYVRAIDLLAAKAQMLRDVPVCNEAGVLVAISDPAQRRRLSVHDVLAAQIELISLLDKRRASDAVAFAPTSEKQLSEDLIEDTAYQLSPEITSSKSAEEGHSL